MPHGSVVLNRPPSFWDLYRWRIIGGVVLCVAEALLIVALLVERTSRRRAEGVLRESQRELRALTGRLLQAQETERRRIARELHDDLNQSLALIAVELDLLAQNPPGPGDALDGRVRELSGRVKQLSSAVHDLSHQLHPAKLEQLGLVAAVRGLCGELGRAHGLGIDFAAEGVPSSIPADTALCLYRIAQEALSNVIKHSGARHARVELRGSPDAVSLGIADDGSGFDPGSVAGKGGLGLVGMRERLRLVGGEISIDSRPSGGTRIDVRIPLVAPADAATGRRFAPATDRSYHEPGDASTPREAAMRRPRVLLADDHRLVREAFARLLEPDCDVVGAVADGRALLAAAPELRPDIVVLDIAMPLLNGLDAARQLKRLMPEVKLIFLTVSEDPDLAAEAFRAGASGYLLKNSAASELLKSIQEVSQGRSYVTPLATQGLVGSFLRDPGPAQGTGPSERPTARGAATPGGGAHHEGDRPHPEDHAPDRRLPQVQHHGGPRHQEQRRAGPVRRQARHRGRLTIGLPSPNLSLRPRVPAHVPPWSTNRSPAWRTTPGPQGAGPCFGICSGVAVRKARAEW